jgi:hypothetical protein
LRRGCAPQQLDRGRLAPAPPRRCRPSTARVTPGSLDRGVRAGGRAVPRGG